MDVRTAMSLKARLEGTNQVEPKWGVERRRAITMRMADPVNRHKRDDVIRYTRKVKRAVNMTHFFNVMATEADMQHVERLLGIV